MVALSEGAQENITELPPGELLPFFADNDGGAIRDILSMTLAWLQKAEGVPIESNGKFYKHKLLIENQTPISR